MRFQLWTLSQSMMAIRDFFYYILSRRSNKDKYFNHLTSSSLCTNSIRANPKDSSPFISFFILALQRWCFRIYFLILPFCILSISNFDRQMKWTRWMREKTSISIMSIFFISWIEKKKMKKRRKEKKNSISNGSICEGSRSFYLYA